jgi:hypothetical protein
MLNLITLSFFPSSGILPLSKTLSCTFVDLLYLDLKYERKNEIIVFLSQASFG